MKLTLLSRNGTLHTRCRFFSYFCKGKNTMDLRFYNRLPAWMRNRYVIILFFFVVWLLFFDSNNLLIQRRQMRELRQLQRDKVYYQQKIAEDKRKLKELESDSKSLEKFAREQYLMKRDNEEIFIITGEE